MSSITNLISVGVNGTGTANSVMKWLDADTATDSIIYDNGTNIGIGTSSPNDYGNTTVTIASTNTTDVSGLAVRNSDGSIRGSLYSNPFTGQVILGTATSHPLVIHIADSERMRIDSSGNVGIGTSSPAGNTNANSRVLQVNSDGTNPAEVKVAGPNSELSISSGNDASYLWSKGAYPLVIGTNEAERMRITSDGNVGIGNTSPSALLEIRGPNAAGTFFIANNAGAAGAIFNRQNANSYPYNFYTFSNGYLGINKTPTTELDVSGSFAASGTKNFKIPHPILEDKHLVHSTVESPQVNNIYRGKVQLINGSATVNLDEVSNMTEGTFVALNRDIHTYTSNESDWDAVRGSVEGNTLTIECQNIESTATVSWLVIGERQDDSIYSSNSTDENGKLIVEPVKEIEAEIETLKSQING